MGNIHGPYSNIGFEYITRPNEIERVLGTLQEPSFPRVNYLNYARDLNLLRDDKNFDEYRYENKLRKEIEKIIKKNFGTIRLIGFHDRDNIYEISKVVYGYTADVHFSIVPDLVLDIFDKEGNRVTDEETRLANAYGKSKKRTKRKSKRKSKKRRSKRISSRI